MLKIKKNDKIKVLSGKDAGKTGPVIQVFPETRQVVVEGLNIIKKHLRASKSGEKGRKIELAGPIAMSKVAVICPKCSKAVRVGFKVDADVKHRVCKGCEQLID